MGMRLCGDVKFPSSGERILISGSARWGHLRVTTLKAGSRKLQIAPYVLLKDDQPLVRVITRPRSTGFANNSFRREPACSLRDR